MLRRRFCHYVNGALETRPRVLLEIICCRVFGFLRHAKNQTGLSKRLLVQIGRIATTTAFIEQEFVLWASAIYAQKTDGVPSEALDIGFQRLLNKWHSEAVHRLPRKEVAAFIKPLRADLSAMWPVRNYMMHGMWKAAGHQRFQVSWWEQTKRNGLQHYSKVFRLSEIRHIADHFELRLMRLYRYFDRAVPSPSPRKSGARQPRAPR